MNSTKIIGKFINTKKTKRRQDNFENSGDMQEWEIAKIKADDAIKRVRSSGLWNKKSVDDTERFLKENYERLRQREQIYNINDYRK